MDIKDAFKLIENSPNEFDFGGEKVAGMTSVSDSYDKRYHTVLSQLSYQLRCNILGSATPLYQASICWFGSAQGVNFIQEYKSSTVDGLVEQLHPLVVTISYSHHKPISKEMQDLICSIGACKHLKCINAQLNANKQKQQPKTR